jgi:hypothetical protein
VRPVLCLQTVQPRLWCRDNYGTVIHGFRWESTAMLWEVSSVTQLRTALQGLPSTRMNSKCLA